MAMRFEHLRTAVQGLRIEPQYGFMRRCPRARIEKAKWLLWYGAYLFSDIGVTICPA
jgi:hypothetical protein